MLLAVPWTARQPVLSEIAPLVAGGHDRDRRDEPLRDGGKHETSGRIASPIAGDDANAKSIVSGLILQIGFEPVGTGTLAESGRQEPGQPLYRGDLTAEEARALARG